MKESRDTLLREFRAARLASDFRVSESERERASVIEK